MRVSSRTPQEPRRRLAGGVCVFGCRSRIGCVCVSVRVCVCFLSFFSGWSNGKPATIFLGVLPFGDWNPTQSSSSG